MHEPVTAGRRRQRSMPVPDRSRLVSLLDSGVIAGAAVFGLTALYFGAQVVSLIWR